MASTTKKKRVTRRKATKNKQVSLLEFRAWLEGVEELQPSDWCPTLDQWKLIRTKIDNIIEPEPEVIVQQVVNNSTGVPVRNTVVDNAPPVGVTAPPVIPSSVPAGPVTEPSPEAANMLTGGNDGKRHTPNIDTTDGNYGSSFE